MTPDPTAQPIPAPSHAPEAPALPVAGPAAVAAKAAGLFEEAAAEAGEPERPAALPLAEVARLFPDLEIQGLIGVGGMGVVYRARHRRLDRLVALKVLPASLARDPQFAERFEREARALARLDHPHIVRVHDVGQIEGYGYLVLEHVDGANLRQVMAAGRLTPKEALAIVPQICEALQYAHDQGVVHRDIKPENVLLDAKGQVKIADFGLAKLTGRPPGATGLTATGQVMGTFEYMAPEQMRAPQDVDHRADLYSLGVVFYEMLTGVLPMGRFEPPSEAAGLDARIDRIVLHALERERTKRYQQAEEIRTDLTGLARHGPAPAPRAAHDARPLATPPSEHAHRGRGILWFAILALPLGWLAYGLVHIAWGGILRGTDDAQAREVWKGIAAAVVFAAGLFSAMRVGLAGAGDPPPRLRHKLGITLAVLHVLSLGALLLVVAQEARRHATLDVLQLPRRPVEGPEDVRMARIQPEVERAWRRILDRLRREGATLQVLVAEYAPVDQLPVKSYSEAAFAASREAGIGPFLMANAPDVLDRWRIVGLQAQTRVNRVRVRILSPDGLRTLGFPMVQDDGVWRLALGFAEEEAAGR